MNQRGVGVCPCLVGSEKEGTGLAHAPEDLKGGAVLEPGPSFPEKWGTMALLWAQWADREHKLGAHQSRGTSNRKIQLPELLQNLIGIKEGSWNFGIHELFMIF